MCNWRINQKRRNYSVQKKNNKINGSLNANFNGKVFPPRKILSLSLRAHKCQNMGSARSTNACNFGVRCGFVCTSKIALQVIMI